MDRNRSPRPCCGPDRRPLSRREVLWRAGGGLGGVALSWLLAQEAAAAPGGDPAVAGPHYPAKAKHVIQIFLAGGVNVSLGHDSIMDPWFPLGRGDMLAAAQLALFLCQMSGYEEIQQVLELITTNAARTLRLQDRYGIEEGKPADFLILDATSTFEALRLLPTRLHVFKAGREVASTTPARSLLRRAGDEQGQEVTYQVARG